MEGQHASAVVFILVICFINGVYLNGRCFEKEGLEICPSPVIIRNSKPVRVDIKCSLTKGLLHTLQIGVTKVTDGSITFLYTIKKEKGHETRYVRGSQSFTPDSYTGFYETDTSLILVLHNASISDLRPSWFCYQEYKVFSGQQRIQFEHPFAPIRAIPYPPTNILTVTPTGGTYNGDSIINLHCKGYSSFNFKVTSQRRLQSRFEYLEEGEWKLVQHEDGQQAVGIVAGAPVVDGDYIRRTSTLKLRVSSIPDCARQFRCLQSYKSTLFAEEAAYIMINVQVCTGNCIPDDVCDHKNITTNSFLVSEGSLLGLSLAIGSAFIFLLILILFLIQRQRKNRKNNRKLLEERRASQIPRQSIALRPTPLIPDDGLSVNEPSSFYSSAPSSVYPYDTSFYSTATDPTSTSVDTHQGML